ncbi:MAG: type II and III secretion system protein [Ignavibacteriaceae bacterium]
MKTIITSIILALLITLPAFSQQYLENDLKEYTNPNELVTLSSDLPFNKAIELLSKVSESTTGKKIVSTIDSNTPIGVEIQNMRYDKALVIIVQMAGLVYEDKDNMVVVKKKDEQVEKRTPDTYASVDVREVKISAVFFELDDQLAKDRGLNWQAMLSGNGFGLNALSGDSIGMSSTLTGDKTATLGGYGDFSSGSFFGHATAVFKFFENQGIGQIIASPNVAVRDGQKGRIQVGQDISVKQRDFAGNVVEKFFSTGSIIDVTPYVYKEDGVDYILLNVNVERSSFVPDPTTTIINKTQASTQLVMLDGEETAIGGLFVNEDQKTRTGVPFLKDLPWWVFGLRYVFGSDHIATTKKELVILLKADLVPTLKERLAGIRSENPLKDELLKQRERMKIYKFNAETETK